MLTISSSAIPLSNLDFGVVTIFGAVNYCQASPLSSFLIKKTLKINFELILLTVAVDNVLEALVTIIDSYGFT